MKRIYSAKRRTLLLILFVFSYSLIYAQDFMMQGWYWDFPKEACGASESWADNLNGKASTIGNAGFTYVWLPPASRASFGACSNGYDPKDLYDLGEYGQGPTGLGTRAEVDALISALSSNGVNAVADVVYNHRDGGEWEDNPAVRDYIMNYPSCAGSTTPYPINGKVRYVLPLGGASGNGAGDYYFKFSSASGSSGFNNRDYKFYIQTSSSTFQGAINESEPNGGGDCSQAFDDWGLGYDMFGKQETTSGCNTDEFKITLGSGDFNLTGDDLIINVEQVGGDGTGLDIRPYGLWSTSANGGSGGDVINQLKLQTRTDFTNLPSGQGAMNYLNFKPNGNYNSCLTGDIDFPYFFFDIEEDEPSTANVYSDFTEWLWTDVGFRGFRMDAVKHFEPALLEAILNHLNSQGITPDMLVGEFYDGNANALVNWVNSVNAPAGMNLRAFDFALRDALKAACDQVGYDARNIFNSGMVDGSTASPFQAVTFVNNHDFREANQPVQNDPMLAYAYILTNNQVGLPCVFYPDYFGVSIPHSPTIPDAQSKFNALIDIHKNYIFGSTSVDYLSRIGTPYTGTYTSGFPNTTLLYQLSGGVAGKEVIVAINFAGEALDLTHTINTTNNLIGQTFYDVLGTSGTAEFTVNGSSEISIQLPARSYAVWVNDGTVGLPVELANFEVYPTERTVQLRWTSANEVNFSHYEVERSLDGLRFEKMGQVAVTNQSLYQFEDRNPVFNQTLYYRLKMVDLDGSFLYSPVKSARINSGMTNIKILPNPTKSTATLLLDSQTAGEAIINIRNINGQGVDRQRTLIREGANSLNLATKDLTPGIYFVYLQLGDQVQLTKLVKL